MKKHLKLAKSLSKVENHLNNVIPKFTFVRQTLKDEGFINVLLKDLHFLNLNLDNMTLKEKAILIITAIPCSPLLFLNKKFLNKFDSLFYKKVFFNKKRKKEYEKIMFQNKEKIKKYKEIVGEESFFIKYIEKDILEGGKFPLFEVQSELNNFVEQEITESYKIYLEDSKEFHDYYMNYSLIKREEEDGSRYFSLLFNNYMSKINKEKLKIESKAQIYNFKKD